MYQESYESVLDCTQGKRKTYWGTTIAIPKCERTNIGKLFCGNHFHTKCSLDYIQSELVLNL